MTGEANAHSYTTLHMLGALSPRPLCGPARSVSPEGPRAVSMRRHLGNCHQDAHSPSSSLLSPVISTDSDSEAREVRLEEAAEVTLACLLPGSRLTQCSHNEELVEPAEEEAGSEVGWGPGLRARLWRLLPELARPMSSPPGWHGPPDPTLSCHDGQEAGRPEHAVVIKRERRDESPLTMRSQSLRAATAHIPPSATCVRYATPGSVEARAVKVSNRQRQNREAVRGYFLSPAALRSSVTVTLLIHKCTQGCVTTVLCVPGALKSVSEQQELLLRV